mmetsp:Transcript_21020/g.56048  ORF Transcript_21020/g.56048 Transcript_21020/m.56048 type:complete len:473 (-) Transcript_21020:362-1780(-)
MTSFIRGLYASGRRAEETACEAICGKGAVEALTKLGQLEDELARKVYQKDGAVPLNHLFMANVVMMVKQSMQQGRYEDPVYQGKKVPYHNTEVFVKGGRYGLHAFAAYENSKEAYCRMVPGILPEDIHHVGSSSDVWSPNYYICVDPQTDEIVLSIRGTANVADALTDLDAVGSPFCGGFAHSGMLATAHRVFDSVAKDIYHLHHTTGRKVAVVGHSLGGGLAVLVMIKLFGEETGLLQGIRAHHTVKCWNYAAPPVFGPPHKVPGWVNSCTLSFVHHVDMVPRACLNTALKFLLAVKAVDEKEELDAASRLAYIMDTTGQPLAHDLPDHVDLPEELEWTYPALNAVGKILLLYKEDGVAVCNQVKHDQLDRILLHPQMLNCHFMTGFQGGYLGLLKEMAESDPPERMITSVIKAPARFIANTMGWNVEPLKVASPSGEMFEADYGISVGVEEKKAEDEAAAALAKAPQDTQ